jgi:acyl-CoA synthetase (AMP-forming)/AMP-acid ligase II
LTEVQFTLAGTTEAVAAAIPDREVLVWRDRRLTHADLRDRSRRLASYLHGRGLGVRTERSGLANHESGQDHLALYLHNGNEYVEGMLGAFKARLAPFNVNYRYVEDELRYLFADAGARAVVYHAAFAPRLAAVRAELPDLAVLIQVDDGSGHPLLPGAVDYEQALAASPPELPPVEPSPDDLYVLYTGGTTGMPKGVLWRQHDIFMSAMGGRTPGVWDPVGSYDDVVARAVAGNGDAMLVIPPFMHGAAQWAAFMMLHTGARVVLPDVNTRMDPADVLRTAERERVAILTVVGDAVAKPLLEEMRRHSYDLSALVAVGNGSAPLTPSVKEQLLELLPNLFISDSVGSSETGAQASHLSAKGAVATGTFQPGPGAAVVSEDLTTLLEPGHDGVGWLAQTGWVPLGYLGDAAKTARTFPEIEGVRYAVPGDRARRTDDGSIELLGRDAVTINTGGEKVFAEEVESALASHPAVRDVTVCGRPSERWGSEVVAVVELAPGLTATPEELAAHAAAHLARYKLPKAWVFVDSVQRSPSGKADYRWAKEVAAAAAPDTTGSAH